ncbi:TniB family NTP-binding protein [Phreatobacter oligotrophus]|uniref:TniB family NTP-binding protein n=1 Tax=Phreatobacter oligotrophus TaxID=1122261 RepID=UPI0014727949|nr:TniB family NTP-binding protein [Phreatobacter oligotrophus]
MDHLDPAVQALVTEPIETRIYQFWPRIFVTTPTVELVFKELDRLFLRGDQARSPNLLIWGDSNVGKTALLERYVRRKMQKAEQEGDVRPTGYANIPAIMISMPTDNNRTEFFELILTRLGRAFNPYGRNEALPVMTRRLMEEVGLRLAIFDEIHNIIPTNDAKDEMLRQIKELSNKIRRPMVLSGTREAYSFISSSRELTERFYAIEIPKVQKGNDFTAFLNTMEAIIPLKRASHLSEDRMAEMLYNLSEGLPGRLSELLFHATVAAVETKVERITAKNLTETIYAQNIIARQGAARTLAPAPYE